MRAIILYVVIILGSGGIAFAQRVQFPTPSGPIAPSSDPFGVAPVPNALGPNLPNRPPTATLGPGIQPFDPYAMPGSALPLPPSGGPGWPGGGWGSAPAPPSLPPIWPSNPPTAPPYGYPGQPYPNPYPAPNPYPYPNPYPNSPPPFPYPGGGQPLPPNAPGGFPGPSPFPQRPPDPGWSGGPSSGAGNEFPPPFHGGPFGQGGSGYGNSNRRFFEHTGFRHTWLAGGDGDELEIHDAEISTTANIEPGLLPGGNGLRVTPGFVFHFLDGPSPPITSHLPSRLYSAYLDFGWSPQITTRLGAEFDARVGVYSDFETFTHRSLRTPAAALGVVRVSPEVAIKVGAVYLDRAKLKLLPAAGILWEPDAQRRFNIFFPSPKIAQYWTTWRNSDFWYYIGGEYGGGSWTFERDRPPSAGASELIDINDIRAFLGLEFFNNNRLFGFFEVGYVFDREVIYVVEPNDSIELNDTLMLRSGLSF